MSKSSNSATSPKTRSSKKAAASKWPIYVAESGRHGRGLFASRNIPADVLIVPLEGKPTTKDGIYVLWGQDEEGNDEGMEVTNDARFVNHAGKPNAAYYDDGVYSLRKILKDEEITHHYGEGWLDVE